MKKNYFLFLGFFLMGLTAQPQSTTHTDPSFVLKELVLPQADEGIIYEGSSYNAEIVVKAKNFTARTWPGQLNLSCLDPKEYENFSYIQLVGKDNASTDDPSFIEIHSIGSAHIERVEFLLTGGEGESSLVCAPSIDGESYFEGFFQTENGESVFRNISVDDVYNICENEKGEPHYYDVPNKIIDSWGVEAPIENAREQIKFVRLNWGKIFSGNEGNKGKPADVLAIKVFMNEDRVISGIEKANEVELDIQMYGRNLQLNKLADVIISDTSGRIVAKYQNVDNVYLDGLVSGIYVISANCNGATTIEKVVIR